MLTQFVVREFLPTEPSPTKAMKGLKKAAERQIVRIQNQPFKVARRGELYEVGRQIGSGAFGKVYVAVDKKTGRSVALKQVRVKNDSVAGILHEVELLTPMRNDYIVRMYDSFRTSLDSIYIALELCTGGELFDVVANMDLPEHIIKQITFEVLSGLQYAHSKQIAHLDIKFENVVLSRPWNKDPKYFPCVKIIDWGLGKRFSEFDSCPCSTVGTPGYVAPEVLLKHYNHKADMWSLGVMIYAMVSGTMPFDDREGLEVLYRNIMQADPSYMEDGWRFASKQCIAFALRLLTRDVLSRPEAEEALQLEWFSTGIQPVRNEFVVSRLSRYFDYSIMKRRFLAHLVDHRHAETIKQLANYFKGVAGKKNTIPAHVVKDALIAFAERTNKTDLKEEASSYALRPEDVIDVNEFIIAMLSPFYNTKNRLLHFYNTNNLRHEMTRESVRTFLNGDDAAAERLFSKVDTNANGIIDVDEFVQWMLDDFMGPE